MTERRLTRWLSLLGMVIFFFLAVISCVSTRRMYSDREYVYWEWDNVLIKLLFLGAIGLFCLLVGKTERFLTEKRVRLLAVGCSCLAALLGILLTDSAHSLPGGDQWYVYVAAEGLFYGDYENLQNYVYYTVCPYQLGIAWLYSVIAQAAGVLNHEVLQYVQAVCAGAGVYFLYLIGKELFRNVLAECLCLLLSVLFLPMYLYSLFFYGETIGTFMSLVCIYFFLLANRRDGWQPGRRIFYWAIAILAFVLVYLVRPALIVVWIALLLIQVFLCIREKRLLPLLALLMMLLAGIFGQKLAVGYVGSTAGVDVDNGMPVAPLTIAMGMQDSEKGLTGAGSYNGYNYNLFIETGQDRPEATRRALRNIGKSLLQWLRSPQKMCGHVFDKVVNQWTEPGYGAFNMTHEMEDPEGWVEDLYYGDLHKVVYGILDCIQTLCYFSLAFWFLYLFREGRRGKTDAREYLIGLILIGEFFFSILWEAKSRYVYPYMVILVPCAAGSFAMWYGKLWSALLPRIAKWVKDRNHR